MCIKVLKEFQYDVFLRKLVIAVSTISAIMGDCVTQVVGDCTCKEIVGIWVSRRIGSVIPLSVSAS